jgi:hypothetical protein
MQTIMRKPIIKPRYWGDITKLAKEKGVDRDTVSDALLGVRNTRLADEIREMALSEPYNAILLETPEVGSRQAINDGGDGADD